MIETIREGSRLDVVLNNPLRLNAMTEEDWRDLAQVGRGLPEDVRVVVLRAEGRSFSAGLDKKVFAGEANPDFRSLVEGSDGQIRAAIAGFQQAFTWWRECHAITIAAVQGDAVGAGFQLALACDLRIVADDVRFSLRETTLGLVPDLAGTKPLVELVGYAKALEIALTGCQIESDEAIRIGLVNKVVPVAELRASVDSLAMRLLALPDAAARATKRLVIGAVTRSFDEQQLAERSEQAHLLRNLAGR